MKALLKFILIFASILLLSAFLAPILHNFLPFKFGRIFNRLVMIFSLAAVVFFVRVRKEDLLSSGLTGRSDGFYLFNVCFASGFVILLILMAIKVMAGMAAWKLADVTWMTWVVSILKVFFTALLIGVIEELFFRGFIFAKLKKAFNYRHCEEPKKGDAAISTVKPEIASPKKNWARNDRVAAACSVFLSIAVTSLFYSLIHFISDKKPFIGPDPNFYDSLLLMKAPVVSLLNWSSYWEQAAGLFIFGVVLNLLYVRTRSLYACVGLHAGCVFFVKLDGLFADSLSTGNLFWGTSKMYDGVAGWLFLASLYFFLNLFLGRQNENKKTFR